MAVMMRLPYYRGGRKAGFRLAAKRFSIAYLFGIIACTVFHVTLSTLQAFTEKEVMSVMGRELGRLLQMVGTLLNNVKLDNF